ncbi:MAG: NAD+ synthase [Candidatus Omnitrophica bacterium]|nr:NAD+ synthase [Candidatus Omnitrophota bacterium]
MKKRIVSWIKDQVNKAHSKGIVLGLSGGVDSCVAAALAKEALGRRRLLALILPIHSQAQDLTDARSCARRLGIKTKLIDLSESYDKLLKVLPASGKIAKANLKPRLRMMVLYYFANKLNYLVCGTGNKAELKVGYFTKYGDGGVDILPLGDLLKRQVRELARELGIAQRIITKKPTAGLWPGQTDEAEMGLLYPELDDILERREKRKKQKLSPDKIRRVERMIAGSQHKRLNPPVCLI